MDVIADVQILPHQLEFINNPRKHPALVGGYGSGKSEAGLFKAFNLKSKFPDHKLAVYAPTYGLLRDIWFEKFQNFCNKFNLKYILNKSDKIMVIQNFGSIFFRSMEDPASIVGYEVHDSIVDELDVLKGNNKAKEVWDKIIARNRKNKPDKELNVSAVMTTPEGFGFVYQKWEKNPSSNYPIIHAKTIDNIFLPQNYIDDLKESYDPLLLRAYMDGEFVNFNQGQVYYAFDQEKHVCENELQIDPTLDICICVDFNVNPMVWEIVQWRSKNDIRIIAEIAKKNTNTWEMCDLTKKKLQELCTKPENYLVTIYGDAAGNSRDTRSTYSDYNIIEQEFRNYFLDLKYKVPRANPPVRSRILCMNNRLSRNAILISKSAEYLIDDFAEIVYTDKGDIDKRCFIRTHASDAFGYFANAEFPIITERKPVGVNSF